MGITIYMARIYPHCAVQRVTCHGHIPGESGVRSQVLRFSRLKYLNFSSYFVPRLIALCFHLVTSIPETYRANGRISTG